jgi:hypothetical protein
MSEAFDFKDEVLEGKEVEMGSLYHSATQVPPISSVAIHI